MPKNDDETMDDNQEEGAKETTKEEVQDVKTPTDDNQEGATHTSEGMFVSSHDRTHYLSRKSLYQSGIVTDFRLFMSHFI